ncbi:MAG: 3-hydroxyisobutyrate dehydrogenase [Pseudomonadales bacterium]
MANIAFIGLGNMGGPMAANLLRAGHALSVFDLVPEALQQLGEQGASIAPTAIDAVQQAEYVISMLPAGKHVVGLFLGEHGILPHISDSALIIDSSTIDTASVQRVAAAAAERSLAILDAPVSGGVAAATAGTLTFMCGGKADAFERAKVILQDMGNNIFLAGDHGAGQVAKMCNNMLLAVHMIGTAEALQLGANNGLDPKVLSEIMLQSSGRNWSLEVYNPYPGVMENAPASNDFNPGFMVNLMIKDLGLAMENSVATHSATPMGALARSLYASHGAQGNGQLDFSSILNLLRS